MASHSLIHKRPLLIALLFSLVAASAVTGCATQPPSDVRFLAVSSAIVSEQYVTAYFDQPNPLADVPFLTGGQTKGPTCSTSGDFAVQITQRRGDFKGPLFDVVEPSNVDFGTLQAVMLPLGVGAPCEDRNQIVKLQFRSGRGLRIGVPAGIAELRVLTADEGAWQHERSDFVLHNVEQDSPARSSATFKFVLRRDASDDEIDRCERVRSPDRSPGVWTWCKEYLALRLLAFGSFRLPEYDLNQTFFQ